MVAERHLGFHQTGNSAIRSDDPKNPGTKLKHEVDRITAVNIAIRNFPNEKSVSQLVVSICQ